MPNLLISLNCLHSSTFKSFTLSKRVIFFLCRDFWEETEILAGVIRKTPWNHFSGYSEHICRIQIKWPHVQTTKWLVWTVVFPHSITINGKAVFHSKCNRFEEFLGDDGSDVTPVERLSRALRLLPEIKIITIIFEFVKCPKVRLVKTATVNVKQKTSHSGQWANMLMSSPGSDAWVLWYNLPSIC